MAEGSEDKRSWTDDQLTAAVAASHSWRGVMRELGLCVTSAGSIRIVKRSAARLGLSTSHFRGQRRWSDAQLRRALAEADCWDDLLSELGLVSRSGDERIRVKAHAIRLGLDVRRLDASPRDAAHRMECKPDIRYLRQAGPSVAAMWFLLCGYDVSIPVEPAIYDLLVSTRLGIKRVQVKTTTFFKDGWQVRVARRPYSVGNNGLMVPYDPDSIDFFFVLDGDLTMYVIPTRVIAGRVQVALSNYSEYVVGSAAFLLNCSWPAAAG